MNPFTKPKIAVYMAGIFLAGGLSGGFIGFHKARALFFQLPPAQNMSEHIMGRFNSTLDLSAEQDVQIKPLVEAACNSVHSIHQKAMEDGGMVMSNMDEKITLLLTPEQKSKFEEMKRERMRFPKDQKRHLHEPPPGTPPPDDGGRPGGPPPGDRPGDGPEMMPGPMPEPHHN
jgi:Spy/CpxP family protein refolding chaperone